MEWYQNQQPSYVSVVILVIEYNIIISLQVVFSTYRNEQAEFEPKVMTSKEDCSKYVNFMIPGTGFHEL